MDKQDGKVDKIALGLGLPSHKQNETSGNNSRSVAKEAGEKVQDTSKAKRGKYKQYEDAQVIIEKIRSYRTQRHPDSEIMSLLDNMPRRTYYNYVKKLQEQDLQITEQWMAENVERVSEELMIYRETLCQKLREIQATIENKNTAPKDKMQAIEQYLVISEKLVQFEKSGRLDAIKYVKYSPPSPY
jgi:uncharacterized protein YPO0396